MNKDLTLVILAAGMGSRFGGLKQIEPVGPNNEFIIDYSIYDAKKAGFNKIVFVIKEENYEIFKETVGKRIENQIEVCYAFQKTTAIPEKFKHFERTKPWGTAHAILAAKPYVDGNFAIINADDFYGEDAFKVASDFLKETNNEMPAKYAMVGYKIENTLTENGSVKRGVCESKDNYLTNIIESSVEKINDQIVVSPLDNSPSFITSNDTLVSMNLFCFTKNLFDYLEEDFEKFLDNYKNDDKEEYLIPTVVFDKIKNNKATVEVLKTNSKWYGVTYKEDKKEVVEAIENMIKNGIYKNNLWEK